MNYQEMYYPIDFIMQENQLGMIFDGNSFFTHLLRRNFQNNNVPAIKQWGSRFTTKYKFGIHETYDQELSFINDEYTEFVGYIDGFLLGHSKVQYLKAWAGALVSDMSIFASARYLPRVYVPINILYLEVARLTTFNKKGELEKTNRLAWALIRTQEEDEYGKIKGNRIAIMNWFALEFYWTSNIPKNIICFLASDEFYINDSDYALKLENLVHPPFEFLNYNCYDPKENFSHSVMTMFDEGTELYELLGNKPLYKWDSPLPTRNGSGKVRIYTDRNKPKPDKVYVYDNTDVPHVFWHSLYNDSCYLPINIIPIGDGRYYAITINRYVEPNPNVVPKSEYKDTSKYQYQEISLDLIESKDSVIRVATMVVPVLAKNATPSAGGHFCTDYGKTIGYYEDGELATQYIKDMMNNIKNGVIQNACLTYNSFMDIEKADEGTGRLGFRKIKAMVLCEEV